MANNNSIFKYKINKSLLHKVPALVKLIMLLPLSVICMSLSIKWLAAGIGMAVIIAFFCKFTIREQLTDLKPALYYSLLLFILYAINNIYESLPELSFSLIRIIRTNPWALLSLRLILIIQLSSLLFRTTSFMEIREALCGINKQAGNTISMFINFIPQIFDNWSIINKAWKARGGKNGIRMIKTTLFVLISLSLEKAGIKAKALEARQ